MAGSILAVVTVRSADDLDEAGYDWAYDLELGENDGILLLDTGDGSYRLLASGSFYDLLDTQSDSFVDTWLYHDVQSGDYDAAVLSLMGQLHVLFSQRTDGVGDILGPFLLLLLFAFLLWFIFDGLRYRRYCRCYRMPGMGVPTVRYYPVFWGRSLYRPRPMRSYPPPVTPRRPTGGGFYSGPYCGVWER